MKQPRRVIIFGKVFQLTEWQVWKLRKEFEAQGISTENKNLGELVNEHGGQIIEADK